MFGGDGRCAGVGREVDRRTLLAGLLGVAALAGCTTARPAAVGSSTRRASVPAPSPARPRAPAARPQARTLSPAAPSPAAGEPATPAQVIARATVPVLCWHQLRDWRPGDDAFARSQLVCPPRYFRAQLDALHHGGWTTISPERYLSHLTTGAPLPPKAVLLSFDDSQHSQITEGLPQLLARGMTATFFLMTVVLGKPDWMSTRDVKRLVASGMTVGAHTWDHHRVDRYSGADWRIQLEQPKALLEKLTGRPVVHFAYPGGLWNRADFPHLAAAGYRTAFQLRQFPMDRTRPLYTLRRIIVVSTWSGADLLAAIHRR